MIMEDRLKKNLKFRNPTRYFDPTITKTMVEVKSPSSYTWQWSRVVSYESRLYYEFLNTTKLGGTTYFYTLTYSEKKCPRYQGFRCFDYEDLRHLLNGGFTKYLLRNYGKKVKYFVSAELGDGKGVRGWHNNPHYHILFFVTPSPDCPYKELSPIDFRSAVRLYWQGFDVDYNIAGRLKDELTYGIVKEGSHLGVVQNFKACDYVAKYVVKDVFFKQREKVIAWRIRNSKFNHYFNSTQSKFDFYDFFSKYVPMTNPGFDDVESIVDYNISNGLDNAYKTFCNNKVNEAVQEEINTYRNRYSNKCRISQGVGEYALQFISDPMNPTIPVPTKTGVKQRPINLYYYRKLFCDKVLDDKGNTMYVLNQKGIDYRCAQLPAKIEKVASNVYDNLYLINSRETFDAMRSSSINTGCWMEYDEVHRFMTTVRKNKLKQIIRKYAEYKLIYEDRFLPIMYSGFTPIKPLRDYRRFITPIVDKVKPYRFDIVNFMENNSQAYMAYHSHPYFLQYHRIFTLFDLITDYAFVKEDNRRQQQSEERKEIKHFHIGREFQY